MTASAARKFLILTALCLLAGPVFAASESDLSPLPPGKKEKAVKAGVGDVSEEALEPAAVETPEEPAAVSLTPEIEGAGLYERPGDGSLGKDFWENTPRSTATKLITAMPASSKYAGQQKLIFGALLSSTNLKALREDAPPREGEDLLTLRLRKLIEGGAYQQALELYSSLQLENPPVAVAKEGILAMLLTAQKTLACVELNSLGAGADSNEFYKKLKEDCNTPAPEPAPAAKEYIYMADMFGALSLYEKALIVANDFIKLGETVDRSFKDTPPAHIQILMNAVNLTDEDKFTLNVRALDWGLISEEEFKKLYVAAIDPDDRLDPELKIPEGSADWQKLPYFLQLAANHKSDEERWGYIKAAFPAAHKYGLSALAPFAELIYKVKPRDVTFQEMKIAAHILNRSVYTIPPQWIDIIEKYTPSADEKKGHVRLLAAVFIAKNKGQKSEELKQRIYKDFPLDTPSYTFFLKNIIENLDSGAKETHTPGGIYENDNNLTFQSDYVMPSMVLWNRLSEASQEGLAGETVLLSAAALRGADLEKIYPGLFLDTLSSLKNVGLTAISENIAIAAVLGSSD